MSLNFKHLRYFWAVAHAGHLTRAAERLNVSQSALSAQIRKLEERLGHALFARRGRQLVLTEAGRIALEHADVIFATGAALTATLARREEGERPALRVGALATLSRNFQVEFLRPLTRAPGARLTVRSGGLGELLALLETQGLDVVLTNQAPSRREGGPPWRVHTLAEQPVSLVGRPPRAGDREPPGDLAALLSEEPLIAPSVDTSVRGAFDALTDRLGVRPTLFAEVDDMALIRVLARERVARAVVPPIVVRDELAAGALVELAALPDLHETFYAVTLPRLFPNPWLAVLLGEGAREHDGRRESGPSR